MTKKNVKHIGTSPDGRVTLQSAEFEPEAVHTVTVIANGGHGGWDILINEKARWKTNTLDEALQWVRESVALLKGGAL